MLTELVQMHPAGALDARIVLSGQDDLDDSMNKEVVVENGGNGNRDTSNQRILAITCLLFTIFVIVEIIDALV